MTEYSKEPDGGLRGIAWGRACISLPLLGLGVINMDSADTVLSRDGKPMPSRGGQATDRDLDSGWIFLWCGAIWLFAAAVISKICKRPTVFNCCNDGATA